MLFRSDPSQGITLTSAGNFNGTDKNDTLTGDGGVNQINAMLGADTITGLAGADVLTGGGGADTFRISAFSESTLAAMDFITDFNVTQGDKIDVPFTTTSVFNRGVISATTLQAALQLAFNDKDSATAGSQPLLINEVVVLQWGTSSLNRNTYVASPDSDSGNFNGDLVIRLPNITGGTIGVGTFI